MRRTRAAVLALLALVAAGYLWWQFGTRTTPQGQRPLATMDLSAFREEFNRTSDATRVVVLLSPT
jgi:hypothetical protein